MDTCCTVTPETRNWGSELCGDCRRLGGAGDVGDDLGLAVDRLVEPDRLGESSEGDVALHAQRKLAARNEGVADFAVELHSPPRATASRSAGLE